MRRRAPIASSAESLPRCKTCLYISAIAARRAASERIECPGTIKAADQGALPGEAHGGRDRRVPRPAISRRSSAARRGRSASASKVTRRRLMTLAAEFETGGTIAPPPGPKIKPGSRLVREWHRRTHTVCVTDVGFEFQGKTYRSLTKIARDITGAQWSGPRFFGLNRTCGFPASGLAGRRQCWCGRCAPGRCHICCGLRFRRSIVRMRRNVRAWYGLRVRSSPAMAFSPASVNFNEYAWPVSSSRRQASIPPFALISRARPARTFVQAAASVLGANTLSIKLNHLPPLNEDIASLLQRAVGGEEKRRCAAGSEVGAPPPSAAPTPAPRILALEKPRHLRSHREQCAPPAPEAPPALRPRPQNPHGSRRAQPNSALSYPRFPPYEAFRRRPSVKPRAPAKGRRPKPFSQAAIRNGPADEFPSSLKSNSQSPRLAMPSPKFSMLFRTTH